MGRSRFLARNEPQLGCGLSCGDAGLTARLPARNHREHPAERHKRDRQPDPVADGARAGGLMVFRVGPSQVCLTGMSPPDLKAELVNSKARAGPPVTTTKRPTNAHNVPW